MGLIENKFIGVSRRGGWGGRIHSLLLSGSAAFLSLLFVTIISITVCMTIKIV